MTALVFGSRLPVGSSARMTLGPFMSARATATRCCSPPDNSPGRCRRRSARPTSASAAAARLGRRDALEHGGHHRVLEGGEITEEVVELEYEADVLTAVSREGGLAPAEQIVALKQHASRRWPIERAEDVQQRGLADARG